MFSGCRVLEWKFLVGGLERVFRESSGFGRRFRVEKVGKKRSGIGSCRGLEMMLNSVSD